MKSSKRVQKTSELDYTTERGAGSTLGFSRILLQNGGHGQEHLWLDLAAASQEIIPRAGCIGISYSTPWRAKKTGNKLQKVGRTVSALNTGSAEAWLFEVQ